MKKQRSIIPLVWSAKDELLRCFIDYLFEEVDVIITENVEIPLNGETLRFFANEERKIPRWLALWLAKKGRAKILTEKNPEELLGKLKTIENKQRQRAGLVNIPREFIIELKMLAEKERNHELKEKLIKKLVDLLRIRIMKLFSVASTPVFNYQELPLIEDTFFNFAQQVIDTLLQALKEVNFDEFLNKILEE